MDGNLKRIRSLYRRKLRVQLLNGLLMVTSSTTVAILFASGLESYFKFSPNFRSVLFLLIIFTFSFSIYTFLLPKLRKYLSNPNLDDLKQITLEIGERFPEIRDRLRNAIELAFSVDSQLYSVEIQRAFIQNTFSEFSKLQIENSLKYKLRTKTIAAFLSTTAAAIIALILFPYEIPSAIGRIVNFSTNYKTALQYEIEVKPGNVQIPRGDTLKILVHIKFVSHEKIPPATELFARYFGEQKFEKQLLKQDSDGIFTSIFPNIRNSIEYFAGIDGIKSPVYVAKVIDLPVVQHMQITLSYPSYTKQAMQTLPDNIGDFSAIVGTRANFSIGSNKDLISAFIVFSDSTTQKMQVSGTNASGSLYVSKSMQYWVEIMDKDSIVNRNPIVYSIQALKDEYPICSIIVPGKDLDLSRDMTLPMRIRIGDDFGFTKLLLQYKLTSSKYIAADKDWHSVEIPIGDKSAGSREVSYLWDLTNLNLVPEDVVTYRAVVFDNDAVTGPKSSASNEFQLRLPSLDEVFASVDTAQNEMRNSAEETVKETNSLKNDLDRLSQQLKANSQQMTWEDQKKFESTLKKFNDIQKQVSDLKNKVESLTQKMLENKILSPQTLEKYLELQKTLQEINSPEFQEALRKLQEALQSLNPNIVRQALQNFQLNEETFRRSIERTLSLLKRIQIEQKLSELQEKFNQMASRQEEIKKQTQKSDSIIAANRNSLTQQEKDLQNRLKESEEELSSLKQKMNEFKGEMPADKIEKAQEEIRNGDIEKKFDDVEEKLASGNFTQSLVIQQQISSLFQSIKEKLAEAQKQMLQNQRLEVINGLRKAQDNLIEISKRQEELRNSSANVLPNSAEQRSLAEKQNELMQQLNLTAQQLMQLSQRSFAVTPQMGRNIGSAYSQMQQALNNLSSRSAESSVQNQSEAMASLNKAVAGIQSTLQAMMQGGQGTGGFPSLLQQLQQMAGRQEGINALTQQLANGGELSMEQQAQLARLAAEQEAVRKSLSQLASEAKDAEIESKGQILGDLDKIVQEMKDVVRDMQSKDIKPETIQRQERILSRLLQASRSIRKQDYDNHRESTPGEDVVRIGPKELNFSNQNDVYNEELLNLIKRNFSPEYQDIILRYLKALKKVTE